MQYWNKPGITSLELILEVAGLAGLIKIIVLVAGEFTLLPDKIPIHYSITGEADGFGSKELIWILPALGCLLYAMLTLLARNPHKLRYPVVITAENRDRQFINMIALLRFIKLFIVGLMVYLSYETLMNARQANPELTPLFLPASLAILTIILAVFIYRSHKFR